MPQLVPGIYGREFESKTGPFGLRCGQMRGHDMVHNGGWYNMKGERIGWGDLSPDDFTKIVQDLEEGELFIILSEHDAFWKFVDKIGTIGSMSTVKPTVEAPGVEYVAEKAKYIIAKNQLYVTDEYGPGKREAKIGGLNFQVVSKAEVKRIVTSVKPN